jgi:acetylornithine deacetylase/succinyl-diaminopimelate desuccinylase-like protein
MQSLREQFKADIHAAFGEVSALAAALVRVSSENPPGDTSAIVSFIEGFLRNECALEMRRVTAKAPIVNLIVKLRGHKPGRRLIFNGHLDTFPVGTTSGWHAPPLGGEIIDGCLYGRGASDMKAGLAVGLITAKLLAQRRTELAGEFVLALVGDEETGGIWGTQHLIANEPDGRGDAMLSADAGAPSVLRFGEKGQLWLEVVASGRASHGAHAHLGENAIERLMVALACLCELRQTHCPVPESITAAVEEASPVSEAVSGKGEKATLLSVTVNIGVILGGTSVNIVPDRASARVDVRFPPGLTVSGLVKAANASIADCPGVRLEVLSSSEANWTEPNSEIVETVARNAREAIGVAPVRNMRPGFSDARFYRLAGIPAVVFGPTPYGMGGVNEHVKLDELRTVFEVHALCAYDYLMRTKGP